MQLGLRLVAAVIKEKNLSFKLEENSIFGDAIKCLEYIKEYVTRTKEFPKSHMLQESLGIKLPETEDSVSYVEDEIRKRWLSKQLSQSLEHAASFLESHDPDKALELIENISLPKKTSITSYTEEYLARVDKYNIARRTPFAGILTPWDTLNLQIQGWVKGTLNVVTGIQSTGKTFFLTLIGIHCLQQKNNILFVTMEMDKERIERRLDCIRFKLPFVELRDLTLSNIVFNRWKQEAVENLQEEGDIFIADKKLVKTVYDVYQLVRQKKPDIVLIDGGYRFQGKGKTRSHWESTVEIVSDLQLFAELSNIPWVVTTQQGDSKETGKSKGMIAWGVRYGKEWVINPDNVIGLYQDADLRLTQLMQIHILKVREGAGLDYIQQFVVKWNFQTMDFSEIQEERAEF